MVVAFVDIESIPLKLSSKLFNSEEIFSKFIPISELLISLRANNLAIR